MRIAASVVLAVALWSGAHGAAAAESYAEHLVSQSLARHPEVAALTMVVTRPGSRDNVVIASSLAPLGQPADKNALQVMKTGKRIVEVNPAGNRLAVRLPLLDASRRAVGALEVQFAYQAGSDQKVLAAGAQALRDEIARRVSHVANLVEPASYDARVRLDNYGQKLVDDLLATHPEIQIVALHVTIPKSEDNVIVASNIGRIGKRADEDDLRVVTTEKPNLEVNSEGNRFEVELVLRDVSGSNIGALGVVYGYRPGDDKLQLQRQAEKVQAALKRHITSAANLFEPHPYVPQAPTAAFAQRLVEATLDQHPELLILALHVQPPASSDPVIIASNIGRIGKKADDDDMGVIRSGTPLLEVNEAGNRFEVELVLLDEAGTNIGAVSTVFAYQAGSDREALRQRGERIRDEMRHQIRSRAQLFESTLPHG